jgi:hypothetical protein
MRPRGAAPRGLARAAVLAALLALPACSATVPPTAVSAPTSGSPPSVAAVPSPTPDFTGVPPGASPLSGLAGGADKPVLVVKLDNTPFAQPHAGLRVADVVYVEEVEYGLTRLAAVFSTRLPPEVGPVRSARITDVELLAQFGTPAFAYSGAQTKLRPVLAAAPFHDVSGDLGPAGYWREPGRSAPYDFFGDPRALLDRAGKQVSPARDIGFVFSETPPARGGAGERLVVRWPGSSVAMKYRPGTATYAVSFDGEPARAAEGGVQQASTVVVQYVEQTDSGYVDKFGGRTPLARTVGSGEAVVLRDGRSWPVRWIRPAADQGTRFFLADGSAMPFAVGQVWVLLVDRERQVRLR